MIFMLISLDKRRVKLLYEAVSDMPLHQYEKLREIALLVSYLTLSETGYITGQAKNIDDGVVMH